MLYKIDKMNFGFNEIDDDFVVFDIMNDNYHVMNETARELVNIIVNKDEISLETIIEEFGKSYEISSIEEVSKDISEVLEKLVQIGLVNLV